MGKKNRRKGKSKKRGSSKSGDRSDLWQAIRDWAEQCAQTDRGRIQPRIAIFRAASGPAIVENLATFDLSPRQGAQVAAIMARAEPITAVTVMLIPVTVDALNKAAGVPSDTGRMKQKGIGVVARGPQWRQRGLFFQPVATAPSQYLITDFDPHQIDVPDWTAPGFRVGRQLEHLMAQKGVQGAMNQLMAVQPAGEPRPVPSTNHRLRVGGVPARCRWETVRVNQERLTSLDTVNLTPDVRMIADEAPIPGIRAGEFLLALEGAWNAESESVCLVQRFGPPHVYQPPDPAADLELVVQSDLLSDRVRWFLMLAAAETEIRLGDLAAAVRIGRRLLEIAKPPKTPKEVPGWVFDHWPIRGVAAIDTAGICAVCGVALWQLLADFAPHDAGVRPASPDPSLWLVAEAVRDTLLNRLRVPRGPTAQRMVALARTALRTVDAHYGDFSIDRWRASLQRKESRERKVRAYAAYHAAMLHSRILLLDSLLGRTPHEQLDIRGAVYPHVGTVAARMLLVASACEDRVQALEMLRSVGDIAGRLPDKPGRVLQSCVNEARFDHRDWDADLLHDLRREQTLAAAAERLVVAEHLGEAHERTKAMRALAKAAAGTPHAWTVDATITLRRGDRRNDPHYLAELLQRADDGPGEVGARLARSLYAGEPASAVSRLLEAVEAARDAATEAETLRQERIEEQLTAPAPPRRDRPPVPTEACAHAAADAIVALRWRLDRPFFRDHALKSMLEAHVKDALPLAQADAPVLDDWLDALGAQDVGLVAALDRGMQTPDNDLIGRSLTESSDALERCLEQTFRRQLFASLGELEGRGYRSERLQDLRQMAAGALSSAAREEALFELAELRVAADALDVVETTDVAVPAGASATVADALLMTAPEDALERSRRQLSTPPWAIAAGLRQVDLYNRAGGQRDLKKLRGPAREGAGLWELRHADARRPVRVVYRLTPSGAEVVAIMAKVDDAHQRRLLARIRGWS